MGERQLGPTAGWGGAPFSYDLGQRWIHASIKKEKRDHIVEVCDGCLATRVVRRRGLRTFAGLTSWVASLLVQARPSVQRLWAALAAGAGPTVHWRQVQFSIV